MADPIDRQAAIDAIRGWVNKAFEDWGNAATEIRCFNAIYPLIMALPSAQPEIIHCEDCKHYNAGFECLIEGYGIERNKDWFCGDAERRTDETTI